MSISPDPDTMSNSPTPERVLLLQLETALRGLIIAIDNGNSLAEPMSHARQAVQCAKEARDTAVAQSNIAFIKVSTPEGDLYRCIVGQPGNEYRIEVDQNIQRLSITNSLNQTEHFAIESDRLVGALSGEQVTKDWTDDDWKELSSAIERI